MKSPNQIKNISEDNLVKKYLNNKYHSSLKTKFDGKNTLSFSDKDVKISNKIDINKFSKLAKTFGTIDADYYYWIINQLVDLFGRDNEHLEDLLNAVLVVLSGISPKNELESMLAIQMCATHHLSMESIRRANLADQTSEGRSININGSIKLMSLFLQQTEGLQRLKGKVNQKIVVEHVTVNEGGKAIVGNVSSAPNLKERGAAE